MRTWKVTAVVVALLATSGVAMAASESDVHQQTMRTTQLIASGVDGDGVVIAVIDSGVAEVPALTGSLLDPVNFSGGTARGDEYGHGTFVAGLIHQTAPHAKILPLKLSGPDGSVDVTQVLAALQWTVSHKDQYGIDIINLSFGNDSTQSWKSSPLNYAVQRAWDAGIVVVVSSGNTGPDGNVTKPGDDPLVITVGSSDDAATPRLFDDTIPDFVSRGPTRAGIAKPDLIAPGQSLISLRAPGSTVDQQYPEARVGASDFKGSGTSFSTAYVSGIVAQMLEYDPSLSPDMIKGKLLAGARRINGDAAAQGAGSANARRAVAAIPTYIASTERSSGRGSLTGTRGSMRVLIEDDAELGDPTTQLELFDKQEYLNTAWDASRWGQSQWGASRWGASRWGASRWGASRWGASEWWASRWG